MYEKFDFLRPKTPNCTLNSQLVFTNMVSEASFKRNVCGNFRPPMSALASSMEELKLQIYCKNLIFRLIWHFITIADPDIGSIKSFHLLSVKHLDQILVNFEQNRMVRTIENFELFDRK